MRRSAILLFPLLVLLSGTPVVGQTTHDLVFRNARILDGEGNPWFRGDVAVDGDRIAAVGELGEARGRVEIDLAGLYLAPGFIDTHSHAGPGLATPELSAADPLLAQGITTVLVNPDGGGPAELVEQREALLRDGLGVNVGQLVPHGSVRRAVMGGAERAATPEEVAAMAERVREGMAAGAWGLSSSPFYVPGRFAETEELVALGRAAAPFGGVYASHIRDESDYSVGLVAAVEEVITVAREAGIPGVVTHVKALGPPVWGYGTVLVRRIEAARASGVEVYADQYPYPASATSVGAALLPGATGGPDSLRARLDRPEEAARIRASLAANLARRGGADRIQFRRVRWDESLEGRLLSRVAEEWGMDPVEASLRILLEGGAAIVSFNMHEDDVRTLMAQPWTLTASDGGLVPWGQGVPHPRAYGTFPRKIRHYAVEEGVVTVEEAVRSMTSLPARVYRMEDRGRLEPGVAADLVVFDLDRLDGPATFTDPHRLAEGMVHVLVNGEFAVRDGEFTDVRSGRILRKR